MTDLTDYQIKISQMTYSELVAEAQRRRKLVNTYSDMRSRTYQSKYYAHHRRLKLCETELKKRTQSPYVKGSVPRD